MRGVRPAAGPRRAGRLSALGLALALAPGAAAAVGAGTDTCLLPGIDDRCETWRAVYGPDDYGPDGMVGSFDVASAVAAAPDGTRTFVTGRSTDSVNGERDYTTVAYDAASGTEAWVARDGGDGTDGATCIAVAPDGSRVYVSGLAWVGDADEYRYATVAYDAATGRRLWLAQHGSGRELSQALAIAVAPDGSRVYVTGESLIAGSDFDYETVAHDAENGATLWSARHGGELRDRPAAVRVSPDGARVFVTGRVGGDYATVAYEAADPDRLGEVVWTARYRGTGGYDEALSLGVSADGSRVFVTGHSGAAGGGSDAATVAYDAATGAQAWEARHRGPAGGGNAGISIAVNDARGLVHIAGFRSMDADDWDAALVTYEAGSGREAWSAAYGLPGYDYELALSAGVGAGGSRVYAAGFSTGTFSLHPVDYVTLAHDAATGARAWAARHNGSPAGIDFDWTSAMAVGGGRVFVTGTQASWVDAEGNGELLDYDFRTVAYPA